MEQDASCTLPAKWRLFKIVAKRNTVSGGDARSVDPRADGMRRYQISFAVRDPAAFSLRVQLEEKKKERKGNEKIKERGDKAVFKRVLTPRQGSGELYSGEASDLENYDCVSPVILVYMPPSDSNTGSTRIADLTALTSSP